MNSKMNYASEEEIEIPVPWGHISGKIWRNKGLPGLALHGIQDNAGTFDRLMPLLSPSISWVCVDFPGHGKSSHMQPGVPLDLFHLVISVKKIVDYFNWDRIYLLGHSLGAQVSMMFASLYPEFVIELVLLDGVAPLVVPEDMSTSHLRSAYDNLEKVENALKTKTPPSYTFEEAVRRLMTNRPSKLTRESALVLIRRSLIETENGFRFSTDQRLKLFMRPILLSLKQLLNIVGGVKCPTLLIIAVESYKNIQSSSSKVMRHDNIVKLLASIPNFNFTFVEGNHDFHLNNANLVAEHINSFYKIKSLL